MRRRNRPRLFVHHNLSSTPIYKMQTNERGISIVNSGHKSGDVSGANFGRKQ